MSTGHNDTNGAANTYYLGASTDASHVFIRTDEPLVAADNDTSQDIYDVSGGAETLVSTGPAGGNGALPAIYTGTSDDGSRVFLSMATTEGSDTTMPLPRT